MSERGRLLSNFSIALQRTEVAQRRVDDVEEWEDLEDLKRQLETETEQTFRLFRAVVIAAAGL